MAFSWLDWQFNRHCIVDTIPVPLASTKSRVTIKVLMLPHAYNWETQMKDPRSTAAQHCAKAKHCVYEGDKSDKLYKGWNAGFSELVPVTWIP